MVVGFGFRDSGGGVYRWLLLEPPFVQGFEFRVPSFGFWVFSFSFRVSGFGFDVQGVEYRAPSLGARVSGFGQWFRV